MINDPGDGVAIICIFVYFSSHVRYLWRACVDLEEWKWLITFTFYILNKALVSVKGQIINDFGFGGHVVSFAVPQHYLLSVTTAIDTM